MSMLSFKGPFFFLCAIYHFPLTNALVFVMLDLSVDLFFLQLLLPSGSAVFLETYGIILLNKLLHDKELLK